MKINNTTAGEKLKAIVNSQIFSVRFIKRSDGTIRDMTCRKGVKFATTGGERGYKPEDHNLIGVFDVNLYNEKLRECGMVPTEQQRAAIGGACYRSINLETIISMKVGGKEYEVNEFPVVTWIADWVEKGIAKSCPVQARTSGEAEKTFKRERDYKRLPKGLLIKQDLT